MTKRIATLDSNNYLIGSVDVPDDHKGGIEIGDLKTNSTYKYDDETGEFVPLGFGFGKLKAPAPYSTEYVLAKLIATMGDDAPYETKVWADWFAAHYAKREDELAISKRAR